MNVNVRADSEAPVVAGDDTNQVHTTVDSRGRKLCFKKIGVVLRTRMLRVLGPEDSQNQLLISHALAAFSVTDIDGDPVSQPRNLIQLEAVWERLGDEGVEAVIEAYARDFMIDTEAAYDTVKN